MEEILARYDEMHLEMIARLDADLGVQPWGLANEEGIGRSGCQASKDPTDEAASLPLFSFAGAYPQADWKRAVEIVQEVGRDYGFTDVRTLADEPGNLDVYGEDGYGGNYDFGMAVNTVLLVKTGCHRWDTVPAPAEFEDPQ